MTRVSGKIHIDKLGKKMLLFILSCVILIHFLISVYDFSFYRIPNLFLGVLLVLYAFYAPIFLHLNTILNSIIVFAVMFLISFILYAFKVIGAGDAKYITITSIWFGTHEIIPLLFTISLMGGGLAIIYLIFKDYIGKMSDWVWQKIQKAETTYPWLRSVWLGSGAGPEMGKRENINPRMIPYGIAIAAGSIIILVIQPITH